MAVIAKSLVAGVLLSTGAVTQYTAPVNVTTVIKAATLCNTSTTSTVKATVYRVTNGGSVTASNQQISAFGIGPGQTYLCPELINKVLAPGDFLSAKDDTGGIMAFNVSGVEIQ